MDEKKQKKIIHTITEFINKTIENPDIDKKIDIIIELYTYLLTKDAKFLIIKHKHFRATVKYKISEFSLNNKIKNNDNFISITNEVNSFILKINTEEDFLELKLNEY